MSINEKVVKTTEFAAVDKELEVFFENIFDEVSNYFVEV